MEVRTILLQIADYIGERIKDLSDGGEPLTPREFGQLDACGDVITFMGDHEYDWFPYDSSEE